MQFSYLLSYLGAGVGINAGNRGVGASLSFTVFRSISPSISTWCAEWPLSEGARLPFLIGDPLLFLCEHIF
jgi:hypothetical protein